jgi:hypothetical protein
MQGQCVLKLKMNTGARIQKSGTWRITGFTTIHYRYMNAMPVGDIEAYNDEKYRTFDNSVFIGFKFKNRVHVF